MIWIIISTSEEWIEEKEFVWAYQNSGSLYEHIDIDRHCSLSLSMFMYMNSTGVDYDLDVNVDLSVTKPLTLPWKDSNRLIVEQNYYIPKVWDNFTIMIVNEYQVIIAIGNLVKIYKSWHSLINIVCI